jgi:DNA adenine methylase
MVQQRLFNLDPEPKPAKPFKTQLLKWVGNKQRFAHEIIEYFPDDFGAYYEPFLGSGAVLGTLAPKSAVGSDAQKPLIQIWQTLSTTPDVLKEWYKERWERFNSGDRVRAYEEIKGAYNTQPNGADLLFISRSCYGGVVRFRKKDGFISTPCGIHSPISPESFNERVDIWHERTRGTQFIAADFEEVMDSAKSGDLIYCDPPYYDTQSILYGAQSFILDRLINCITRCKMRGVYVVLSIDGTKKTGKKQLDLPIPETLFERMAMINCGKSMLRRFQLAGETLEDEVVADRLLLTY